MIYKTCLSLDGGASVNFILPAKSRESSRLVSRSQNSLLLAKLINRRGEFELIWKVETSVDVLSVSLSFP